MYCNEDKDNGIMTFANGMIYGLCYYDKDNKQYQLLKQSKVKHNEAMSFRTKKEAKLFCKNKKIPYNRIIKYGNRFENIWSIQWGNSLSDVYIHTINNFKLIDERN